MYFDLIGEISDLEVIAGGSGIRRLPMLERLYGRGRWRKLKGIGLVRLADGGIFRAEIHWYEAHGIGKKEMKIKRLLTQEP